MKKLLFLLAACIFCFSEWDAQATEPLKYVVVRSDHQVKTQLRDELRLYIVLAHKESGKIKALPFQEHLNGAQLAATVVAAAKYHAEYTQAPYVAVKLYSQAPKEGFSPTILATVEYAQDGRGLSGLDIWTWRNVNATPRGLSTRERNAEVSRRTGKKAPDGQPITAPPLLLRNPVNVDIQQIPPMSPL